MTAVEELALRIRSGNVDPTRGAAILEKACADAVALAAQRFEAALEAMTISLTSELATWPAATACSRGTASASWTWTAARNSTNSPAKPRPSSPCTASLDRWWSGNPPYGEAQQELSAMEEERK